MKFRIDLRIFLFLILFYFTKQIEMYLLILLFAFIHELGHLFVGLIVGMKPEKIGIMPSGINISFKVKPQDYNVKIKKGTLLELKKIIVASAGPITNFILIIISGKINLDLVSYIMVVLSNLIILIFNLLPIYPLDGGRILKGILHILIGKKKSFKYIHIISTIFIIIITVIASIAILYLQNIAIFIAMVYVWYMYLIEDSRYRIRKKTYEIIENY